MMKGRGKRVNGSRPKKAGTGKGGKYMHPQAFFPNFKKERSGWAGLVACLSLLLFLIGIVLGVFIVIGSMSPSKYISSLYLVDISTTTTANVQFTVGYFGGCASAPNITQGTASNATAIHCIQNNRAKNITYLTSAYVDELSSATTDPSSLRTALSTIIPLSSHFQQHVFHPAPPVIAIILLTISGLTLFALSTNRTSNMSYRRLLVVSVLSAAAAMALTFVTVIGGLEAGNGLVGVEIDGGVAVSIGKSMRYLQIGWIVVVGLFYTLMGMLYARA